MSSAGTRRGRGRQRGAQHRGDHAKHRDRATKRDERRRSTVRAVHLRRRVATVSAAAVPPAGMSFAFELAPVHRLRALSARSRFACTAMSARRHVELHARGIRGRSADVGRRRRADRGSGDAADGGVARGRVEHTARVRGAHEGPLERVGPRSERRQVADERGFDKFQCAAAAAAADPSSSSHARMDGSALCTAVAASLRTPGTSIMRPRGVGSRT